MLLQPKRLILYCSRQMSGKSEPKKAIVSNLLTNIVKTHKEQGKNIQVNYVLLDTDGSKTTDEAEIDSVQFEVLLLGKNDRIESTSIQRVQLNEIEEG